MTDKELIAALRRNMVETGGLICLGCGHEHGCSVHGCAILREAAERIEVCQWIPVTERMPEDDESVMVAVYGKPCENITFNGAYEFATYSPAEGWILEHYPEWEHPVVSHWMPLPEDCSCKFGRRKEAGHEK